MQTRDQRIYKVTLTGSIVNMVLLVMKFVAGDISLGESHTHATEIERRLRAEFGAGTHIMLHIEPIKPIKP